MRKDDKRFKSVEDIRGKIVVAAEFWALEAYQLQASMLHKFGINPLFDAKQVQGSRPRCAFQRILCLRREQTRRRKGT